MKRALLFKVTLFGVLVAFSTTTHAAIRLPAIFSDHMALQADTTIRIWGWGDPGETVVLTLEDHHVTTTSNIMGKWAAALTPMKRSVGLTMTVAGKNTITIHDIVIGEVWVCSGQSNMEWPCKWIDHADTEIADAKWPKIRLFMVKHAVAESTLEDIEGAWCECSPESIKEFSAVAYFFGRELHQRLNVPVGLIQSAWGGTPAEAWTRRARLEADPEFKKIVELWDARKANMKAETQSFQGIVDRWQAQIDQAKAERNETKLALLKIQAPIWWNHPITSWHRPANLYNGMIAPLMPFTIRGVIWYQGETNANRPDQYAHLFPMLIQDWRQQWGQRDFPFLFVQLASYMPRQNPPTDSNWARLREAQAKTLSLPNTGMAVTIDIGSANDIHPKNKLDVGRRLAVWALHGTYGQTGVIPSGPIMHRFDIEGNKIRVKFKFADGGLVNRAKGQIQGFAIAGEDRKFAWAESKIEGDIVVVWNDDVKNPVAVRYGWADNPAVSLFNSSGLPVAPFRTDEWPYVDSLATTLPVTGRSPAH